MDIKCPACGGHIMGWTHNKQLNAAAAYCEQYHDFVIKVELVTEPRQTWEMEL